ncbi:MAG TPA: hypothetical protein VGC84_03080, partial [Ilumatobacteraceae bacterium]
MRAVDRVQKIAAQRLDDRQLRIAILAEIGALVRFDVFVWLVTDPDTCVGSAPVANAPSMDDLPALIRLKYLASVNRWTSMQPNTPVSLVNATNGDLSRSRMWNEVLRGYGVTDVASITFSDQFGCWGFLDLWRRGEQFSVDDMTLLHDIAAPITVALRRSVASSFDLPSTSSGDLRGPAVVLMSDDLELVTQTAETDAYLRALLPTPLDQSPIPAAVYNVAAQ